jgi:hypothetical protein
MSAGDGSLGSSCNRYCFAPFNVEPIDIFSLCLALVTLPKRYVLEVLTGQANFIHAHFALVTGSDDISGSTFV